MDHRRARARAADFAKLLGVWIREGGNGTSIWIERNGRAYPILRVPTDYPDHVVVPPRVYTEGMGPVALRSRAGSAIIRREAFNARVWASVVGRPQARREPWGGTVLAPAPGPQLR